MFDFNASKRSNLFHDSLQDDIAGYMKKYWVIAKMSFGEQFMYRTNLALEVVGSIAAVLAILLVWKVIMTDRGGFIGDYTPAELVTYFVVVGWIFSFIFLTGQGDDINDSINNGWFSFMLVRPMHPMIYYAIRDFARKIITGSIGLVGIAAVCWIFRDMVLPPVSIGNAIAAILLVLAGSIIHYLIFSIGSIVAFWMEQTWGIRFVMRVVIELAMGILIPISLFPPVWQKAAYFMPFHFMGYFPAQIYLGKSVPFGCFLTILLLAFWLSLLFIIHQWIYKKGVRIYEAPGS